MTETIFGKNVFDVYATKGRSRHFGFTCGESCHPSLYTVCDVNFPTQEQWLHNETSHKLIYGSAHALQA